MEKKEEKKAETKVGKMRKMKVRNEGINRKGRGVSVSSFHPMVFQRAPRRFRRSIHP